MFPNRTALTALSRHRAAMWLSFALALAMSACASDIPVVGPKCGAVGQPACDAGAPDIADVSPDATIKPTVDFYLNTKVGTVLSGVTTAALNADNDNLPGKDNPGIQVDLVVKTDAPAGTQVEAKVGTTTLPPVVVVAGEDPKFAITVPCSSSSLPLVVSVSGQNVETVAVDKTISQTTCPGACQPPKIEPVAACLNLDMDEADPGFQQAFTVTASAADCPLISVRVIDTDGKPSNPDPTTTLTGTQATILVTLSPNTTGLNGSKATVTATASDPVNTDREVGTSQPLTVTITTDAPTISNVTPLAGALTLTDDADPATPGMQITLKGTTTAAVAGDPVTVAVDGALAATGTVNVDGTFEIPLTLQEKSDGTSSGVSVKVAHPACKLESAPSKVVYFVKLTKADLAFVSPAEGAILLAKDNGPTGTASKYATQLQVSVTSGTTGANLSVFCRKAGLGLPYPSQPVGTAIFADLSPVAIDVLLDVDTLGNNVTCKVVDDAPNPAVSATEVSFTIALPPPVITVTQPASAVTVTTYELPFVLQATNLEGRDVSAVITSLGGVAAAPQALGKVKNGGLVGKLLLQDGVNLLDGTYTVTFDALDGYGNSAAANLASAATVTVTLDTTPPAVLITAPTKDSYDALVDADAAVTAGYQIDVAVAVDDAVQVCLQPPTGSQICKQLGVDWQAGDPAVTFAAVTLQPGPNTLTVDGKDAAGNQSPAAPKVITLVSELPQVQFTTPTGNVVTTGDTVAFTAVVSTGAGAAVSTSTYKVLINNVEVPTAVTETSAGTYTFVVAVPKDGSKALVQFGAAADGTPDKFGFSAEIAISFKATQPTLVIAVPADQAVINGTSALCTPGSVDCLSTIQLTTTNAEDGSAVSVAVDCGGGKTQTLTGKIAANAASLPVTLPDQSTCTLAATVTDAAGQTAQAGPISVQVDRVAPQFFDIVLPIGKTGKQVVFVAKEDIGGNPLDGEQVNLQIQVAGVVAGQTLTLTVTDDSGKVTGTFTGTATVSVDDATKTSVAFGVVTMPEGDKVKLTFTATDAAGNVGSTVITAKVATAKPELLFGEPINNAEAKSCTASSQCAGTLCVQGKCAAAWNKNAIRKVTIGVAGVPNGGVLNICVKGAGIGGAACQTAGFSIVATETVTAGTMAVVLPALPEGVQTLIAEASFLPLIPWTSTLESIEAYAQQRTVLVDTIAPTVNFTLPVAQNALGVCLNAGNEVAPDGGQPGGGFSLAVTSNEDAGIALFGNGAPAGTGAVTAGAGNVAVTLPAEGTQVLAAKVADAVGNQADVAIATVLVDTQKPTGAFAVPAGAKVLVGDALDVQVAQISSDVEGLNATIFDAGVSKGQTTVTGGVALFPNATFGLLTQGDHTLSAQVTDFCGNQGIIGTNPSLVTVDLQPPTAVIATPAEGATFGDADDAAPTVGGYQVSVTFGSTDAASYKVELADGCDATFANCNAFNLVKGGAITAPGGNEPAVLTTIPFSGGTPQYVLKVTVTDANGNVASATRPFKVQLSGCIVSLTGLAAGGTYNTKACAQPGLSCASISTELTAEFFGPCGAVASVQFKKGGAELAKVVPGGDFKAKTTLTVNDGDNTTVEAIALDAGGQTIKSSGALPLKADLTLPKVAFIAGSVLGTPTAVDKDLLGKAKDLNAQPGHQAHLQVQATDAGLAGGSLTKLERTVAGVTAALTAAAPASVPVALNAASATIDVQFATLTEDAVNTVTATVTDAAGNVGTATATVTVDWQAPAALKLADLTAADLNVRRPLAKLSFTASGDNGANGTASSYDVRYSKKPINTQADFDAACLAKDLPKATINTPKAAGQADEVFVEGPDPRDLSDPCKFTPLIDSGASAWYFAVAVSDAAGNKSAPSNTVSTTALRMRYANIVLGGAQATTDMRQRVNQVGDLNGDGLGDFALGGGTSSPLCIIYGRNQATVADIDLSQASAYPSHVCLTNPGGLGLPVARGGDVNGDGIVDLVVGVGTGTGTPRSVRVYLGKKGAAIGTTPALTINNIEIPNGDGVWKLTTIGNFNGDIAPSGKPLMDIAVTSRSGTFAYDRVLVIPGIATLSDASPKTIDVNSATSRATFNVASIHLVDSTGAPAFGSSLLGVGNLLTDAGNTQFDDIAIGQASANQAVYVVKGRALSGDTEIVLSKTLIGANDAEAVNIKGSALIGISLFGLYTDVVNVDDDGIPDLVIQHSQASTLGGGLYWIRGAAIQASLGKILDVAQEAAVAGETNLFALANGAGYRLRDYHFAPQAIGNFADRPASGKPIIDIAHGRASTAPDGGSNRVVVRLGQVRAKSAIPNQVSFQPVDLAIFDPANNAATNWGIVTTGALGPVSFAPIGDFNGDGLVDLAIGSLAGSLIVVY